MGKILVIRGGALGDFILTLPALRLLRENHPDNHVEILGHEPVTQLAVKAGLADATRSIEHGAMAGFFIPGGTLAPGLVDYFSSFNLVISYLYDPDGYFRGNLEKAGVKTLIEGIYKVDENGPHAARQLAATLEQLALFLDDPAPRLLDPAPPADRKIIAIHPGSGSPRKNWPVENWKQAAALLAENSPGTEFLLITGEAEEEHAGQIAATWTECGIPFEHARALPLWTLAEKLAACSLFLGHDTGVSHLAAATGIPALLLFGPTNPTVWAPQNPAVTIHRPIDYQLKSLSVDDLISLVAQKMEDHQT